MNKSGETNQVAFCIRNRRRGVLGTARAYSRFGVAPDMIHHALDGFDDAAGMREPVVCGGWKYKVRKAKLLYAPHSLNERGVQQRDFPRMERDGSPDGIVDMLVMGGATRISVRDKRS